MFQYALGRRIASEKKTSLMLDLTWFNGQVDRQFQLSQFKINATFANENETSRITNRFTNKILKKIANKYQHPVFDKIKPIFLEANTGQFSQRVFLCPKTCLLIGYWQSEKYFNTISDELRKEFVLVKELSSGSKKLYEQILLDPNSVSVHIRRGDYIAQSMGHHLCSMDYYERAIDYLFQRHTEAKFYVFSDDIEWARANFIAQPNTVFIEPSENRLDAEELILMSCCHHHINANSSFSWWGAWLGEKEDSIVIVPNRWFVDRPFPEDRVPARWKRL